MIPKKIHYCWFGGSEIPDQLSKYISTWKRHCPDYDLILWNEDSFDPNCTDFTRTAYALKKYAFVSDYVRAYALYHDGGIYLDTDVEIKENLDPLLQSGFFAGLETEGVVSTAVLGSSAGHEVLLELLQHYQNLEYRRDQEANTKILSRIIQKKLKTEITEANLDYENNKNITIYPPEVLTLESQKNYATHHFYGSWVAKQGKSTKASVACQNHITRATAIDKKDFHRALSQRLSISECALLLFRVIYHRTIPSKIDALIASFRK